MKRVLIVIGTRPDGVKMAPVFKAIAATAGLEPRVLASGQHLEQLEHALRPFNVPIDVHLDLAREDGESLGSHYGRLLGGLSAAISNERPDYVLVHGDTATCAAAGLAAFLTQVPFGHVEAGLRTRDLRSPFPEEANRRLVDSIADLLFAPTPRARENLLAEGIDGSRIVATGQTAVDAVHDVRRSAGSKAKSVGRRVVITLHRRENWPHLDDLMRSLVRVARENGDVEFVFPVHLNPSVRAAVRQFADRHSNLKLVEPLGYAEMIDLLASSALIVTDSGGLQEEGITLGVPVVVLRDTTERPEAVEAGGAILVGTDPSEVRACLSRLLSEPDALSSMTNRPNPFGDGRAAGRIAEAVAWSLIGTPRPDDWVSS